MPDEDNTIVLSPPTLEGERRKEIRRQTDRQGKYDRRRNRCANCQQFTTQANNEKGYCQLHQLEMDAFAFGCPQFSAIPGSQKI